MIVRLESNRLSIHSRVDSALQVAQMSLPGGVTSHKQTEVQDPLWGHGQRLEIVHQGGLRCTTITVYENDQFAQLHTTIINGGKEDLDLNKTRIAGLELRVGDKLQGLSTLGTGGMKPIETSEGSFTYTVLADPGSCKGIVLGWLTQLQGVGLMEPVLDETNSTYTVNVSLEFGHYRVKPGAERGTDVLIIGFFQDVRAGLENYGDTLAKAYRIKLPPKPNVYCTWYHRNSSGSGASTEKLLEANAMFAAEQLKPFGLSVMQIDDNWQSYMTNRDVKPRKGPITTFLEANEKFPDGMKFTAVLLKGNGFVPGIWFMPFSGDIHHHAFDKAIFATDAKNGGPFDSKGWSEAPIDSTAPAGEAFLHDRFRRIYDWGYRYFKIDGLHSGAPSLNIYVNRGYDGRPCFADAVIHNPDMTFVQCFRHGMDILHEEAPDVFLLGCTITQNMSAMGESFGMVDAMRVGPDNDRASSGVWKNVLNGPSFAGNLYFLNNRVWYNDPDPWYARSSNPLPKARWMASWQAVSGAINTTSMQYADLEPERLDLIKRTLPTHSLNARPVDILERSMPRIWIVGNERMHIVGLFNDVESKPTVITTSMQKMSLDPSKEYDCFEFWSNRYLGRFKGSLERTVAPASCEVLALREARSYPQVISTSRHITQGLMDVVAEHWDPDAKQLSGTSRVVAGDPYELRVVLPQGFSMTQATCGGTKMELHQEGSLARANFIPEKTTSVEWTMSFSKQAGAK
jgi:hypothetical protein